MPFDPPEDQDMMPWYDPEAREMVHGYPEANEHSNGDFRVSVIPVIFNDRVVVTHRSEYMGLTHYVAGFCYDKGLPAMIAADLWVQKWAEMDIPLGFKKEAFNVLHCYGKVNDRG